MKTINTLLLFLVVVLFSCNNIKQDKQIDSRSVDSIISPSTIKSLDNKKVKIIGEICEQYPEIKLTSLVLLSNDINDEVQELYYKKDFNDFYFGEYVEYSVLLRDEEVILKLDYLYSVGQAFSASGQILYNKITHDIIKIEYNYGTGKGATEIYINGKSILEKINSF